MRKTRAARLFAFVLFAAAGLRAAPAPLDLGQGLAYLRLKSLPADLSALPASLAQPALVLDLRFATAEAADAAALRNELAARADPRAPVFILFNAETSPALRQALAASAPLPGVVTLGPAEDGSAPDLALPVSPADDRRAYDALDHGTPVTALITEKIAKPRFDEAVLDEEHAKGLAPDFPPPPDPTAKKTPEPPPPLIDAVLQRAVQLHRALLALGKIPAVR